MNTKYKNILAILSIYICTMGCFQEETLEEASFNWKNEDLQMVITGKNRKSRDFILHGTNINNKHDTAFSEQTGYLVYHYEDLHIGDTLIKNKGKYNMQIYSRFEKKDIPFRYNAIEVADTLAIQK